MQAVQATLFLRDSFVPVTVRNSMLPPQISNEEDSGQTFIHEVVGNGKDWNAIIVSSEELNWLKVVLDISGLQKSNRVKITFTQWSVLIESKGKQSSFLHAVRAVDALLDVCPVDFPNATSNLTPRAAKKQQ